MAQRKGWCFTLNNYTQEDIDRLKNNVGIIQYAIWGEEVAPTTGTKHLQGYVLFKSKQRFNAVKSILGSGCHIEGAKGSPQQNFAYCSKDGAYEELGELAVRKKSSLELCCEMVKNGVSMAELAAEHPQVIVRHYVGLVRLQQLLGVIRPRDFKSGE